MRLVETVVVARAKWRCTPGRRQRQESGLPTVKPYPLCCVRTSFPTLRSLTTDPQPNWALVAL
ncbi:hypothetical protein E2C01_054531 [Portunus trituberculatus]|uniref:Uncharacterized protein n=1 Tax=Portunus trituberculatus TaxID=210409 RepID=A0A5B7GS85_PORTR|nr:hypothetical protein [Portunus trituberculatus]